MRGHPSLFSISKALQGLKSWKQLLSGPFQYKSVDPSAMLYSSNHHSLHYPFIGTQIHLFPASCTFLTASFLRGVPDYRKHNQLSSLFCSLCQSNRSIPGSCEMSPVMLPSAPKRQHVYKTNKNFKAPSHPLMLSWWFQVMCQFQLISNSANLGSEKLSSLASLYLSLEQKMNGFRKM